MTTEGALPEYDSKVYWKGQSFQLSVRLHLQHWIWSHQLGYHIHPKIDLTGRESVRVADIASGNGCDGFDITKAHFPAQHWLPDTVNFHVWDAFSEVPEEYVGAFDVVHTRTIYSAIANNNVEPLLSNMLKMLKPGGYLQWDELDASTLEAHVPPNVSGEKTEMIVRVMDLLSAAQNNLRPEWLHNLGTTMQDKGCTVVADDRLEPRKELVKAWSDNMLFIWGILNPSFSDEDMRLPPGKGVPETISRSSFAKLVAECAEEMQNGVGADMKSIVVVGQKAS